MINQIKRIIKYKDYIIGTVKRDFKIKYKSTTLGPFWLIAQPLSMLFVYTIIFSNVMKVKLAGEVGVYDYSIYLCSGLLTWGVFTEIIQRMKNMYMDNANIIKKSNFPKITLPIIITLSATINFIIIFTIFLIVMIFLDKFSLRMLFYFTPVFFLQLFFTVSIGMLVSMLNVFYRDIGQTVDIIIQFLFWATPIVYVTSIMPLEIQEIIMLNPMSRIIESYHDIFVYKSVPDWYSLTPVMIISFMFSIFSFLISRRVGNDIVDEI